MIEIILQMGSRAAGGGGVSPPQRTPRTDGQTVPLYARRERTHDGLAARRPRSRGKRRVHPWRWLLVGLLVAAWHVGPARAQARAYTIDAHASSVQVQVERAGVFALLAHNHVFVAEGFAGRITVDPADLSRSSLQLTIPLASLQVDPQDARDALGLAGKLDDSDRAEIREHMMAPHQLDLAHYPRVTATLASVSGTPPDLVVGLRVRIKETEKVLRVPVHLELSGSELRVQGEAEFLQSDFGIKPYSTLLGAISVKDRVRVRFRIVARAETG